MWITSMAYHREPTPPATPSEYNNRVATIWGEIRQLEQERIQLIERAALRRHDLGELYTARDMHATMVRACMDLRQEAERLDRLYEEMRQNKDLPP